VIASIAGPASEPTPGPAPGPLRLGLCVWAWAWAVIVRLETSEKWTAVAQLGGYAPLLPDAFSVTEAAGAKRT